jgi:hypothetical protein
MRRIPPLILIGALALSACSEDANQTPTSPAGQPAFDKGVPCPTTSFPFPVASDQIKALYPNNATETAMVARAFDISKKWSQCKVADPQGKVADFVRILLSDFLNNRLNATATATDVQALINTMYSGVGLTAPIIPLSQLAPGGDVGSGLFIPGQVLIIRTSTNNAATKIPANAFNENTLITIYRLRDDANPLSTDFQPQFPPFYDINASNASGTHNLNSGTFALLGLCLDDADVGDINDPAIGHNRFPGGEGSFEVLPALTAAEYASLGLACPIPANEPDGSAFLDGRSTLGDLAQAAIAVLLPKPLLAASSVGNTGVGGRASSYSPFGIVDRSPGE